MTFWSSGTGMGIEDCTPKVWEREGLQIHSHILGMGIRRYLSRGWPGTGMEEKNTMFKSEKKNYGKYLG